MSKQKPSASKSSHSVPKCLVHGICSRFTVGRQDVSVDISRHSYGCVTEDLANHLQFDATREHQACRRVAQFMWMPMVKSSSLADDCEVSIEVSRINRRTKIRRKNEACIGPEIIH